MSIAGCDFLNANTTMVLVSSDAGTTWLEVGGLNEVERSFDDETSDASTFETSGRGRTLIMSITDTFALTGLKKRGDPGQAALDNASRLLGCAGLIDVKIVYPDGGNTDPGDPTATPPVPPGFFDEIWEMTCAFEPDDVGGGLNDLTTWGGTLTAFEDPVVTKDSTYVATP